jgi:uncharacterized membrane protein YidH (DUF202 family)
VTDSKQLMINEAQLVLAEKRTSLAALRTGMALLGLPMAIISFLIAMSEHYHVGKVLIFLLPVVAVCTVMATVGAYLCWRAITRIHRADTHLAELKEKSPEVGEQLG